MNFAYTVSYRTRSWSEGIPILGVLCHICSTAEKVYRGTSESLIDTGSDTVKTKYPAYWCLCIKCHNNGWQEPQECRRGYMTYVNVLTGIQKKIKIF